MSLSVSADWKTERESLGQVFISKPFRLFYDVSGQHALKHQADKNHNDVPDIIENTALQLQVFHDILNQELGFMTPFESSRYRNKLQTIDIHFLKSKNRGSSGDALVRYHYQKVKVATAQSLSIKLSSALTTGNLTPAHELFHAYANGYTLFKNRWLTEGTARWSEYILRKGGGPEKHLPVTYEELKDITEQTYETQYFWNKLSSVCTVSNSTFKSSQWNALEYIGSSTKVLLDDLIIGSDFIKALFVNLSLQDAQAAIDLGLPRYDWKEQQQKSKKNHPYIMRALKHTIEYFSCQNKPEMQEFVDLLNAYIKK